MREELVRSVVGLPISDLSAVRLGDDKEEESLSSQINVSAVEQVGRLGLHLEEFYLKHFILSQLDN